MKIKFLAVAILLASHLGLRAQSQPGYLDTTFNATGAMKGKKDLFQNASVRGMAVDDQGRIIAAACSTSYSYNIYVVRIKPDGGIDAFGTDTLTTINFPSLGASYGACTGLILQKDGKILISGHARFASDQMVVIRLNSNGTLDNTFDSDGIVTIDITSASDLANDIALQSDGKIIVTGSANGSIAIVRLNTDGTIDTSFNGNMGNYISPGTIEKAVKVAVLNDTIIVAGDFNNAGYTNFTVLKNNPDGTPDTSFGILGRKNITTSAYNYSAALLVQPDGKILIGGSTSSQFKVVRLHRNGALDNSFGTFGAVANSIGISPALTDILLDKDAKIILSGYAYNSGGTGLAVMKLHLSGALDTSFADSGKLIINSANPYFSYKSALSKDNKLLLGGQDNTAQVSKIHIRPVIHIQGSDYVLPKSGETYKVVVPPSWSYTYRWVYTGQYAYFFPDADGSTVFLFFSDTATAGKLICYAESGSVVYAYQEKDISVNANPTNANELAALSCLPDVTDCYNSYIDLFSLGSINNQFSGCSNNGYSDFTRSDFADTLAAGGVYSANIVLGASDGPVYVGIWIDYNNDGDFNSSDEFVGQGDNSADISIVKVTNIIFKNKEGYAGPKRLRVRSRPNVVLNAAEYCQSATGNDLVGETEDYLIVISEQTSMEAPQIITPNDDGKNDYFVIRGIDPEKDNKNKLTIFDRAGKVQYAADQYQNNWNGINADGNKLTPGTYYYVFVKNGNEFIRGFVEIRY